MRKLLLMSLCLVLLAVTQSIAQTHIVTGTVTAKNDGSTLPGVSVSIKGTTTGTQTDINGKYSINAPVGSVLTFSFIGYTAQSITVSGNALNVALEPVAQQLGEVVVTGALGISRTRNQQVYAAEQVNGDEVSKQRQTNFIDGLSGKVAGLQITQNNDLGASTNVVLRGYKSIYGNNQALFIIDGVPIDNSNINSANQMSGGGGYDYGSPASDINPDDIESVTVLKGAGATALYGSRGANGVILITTKKGKKGLGITVNSTETWSQMDKSTFPKYQDQYGAGYGQFYNDPSGYFFYFDVNGDGKPDLVTPTTEDASFGAKFDPSLMVYQWDAFDKTSPNFGKATPWVAAKNGPASFFQSPISTNESILITNGTDQGDFKLGYTNSVDRGIIPNSSITKNQIVFGADHNLTSKLTVGANVNYTRTDGIGRGGTGYDGTNSDNRNVLTNFREWWETNVDVQELKAAYNRTHANTTWNMADPQGGDYSAIFWNNPYWVTEHNYETDMRNRYIGDVHASYKPTNWLTFTGSVSLDSYSELDEERYDVTSIGVPYYSRFNNDYSETNYNLLANINKNLGSDFNLKALLGTNIRRDYTNSIYASTNGGLIVPGVYSLSNSLVTPLAPTETDFTREVDGVFAGATLSWKNMITLDGTIRRDQSSTLPKANNTYYYPSVSAGFVFSQLLKDWTWLSYAKLRGSYAEVGNDAPVYRTLDTYNINSPFGSAPQTSLSNTKNNGELRPERTRSTEVGLELSFLDNRLGFDGTYYNGLTFDEILPVNVSSATGYTNEYLNAGSIRNKGVEISLLGTPVRTQNFSWNIRVNWSRNVNKVESLYTDGSGNEAKNLELGSFQNGESINAPLGGSLGTIEGSDYTYLNGQKVVKANGQYQLTATNNHVIGNTNPDWIGGVNNEFRYKNFSFSFLIDVRKGGSVFSQDMAYGLATGLYPETVYTNDLGKPVRNSLADGGGFIRPGVTANGAPNTKRIAADNYTAFGYVYLPDRAFIYDASFVKLREALIGYTLPQSVVNKLGPVKGVTLQVIGHNLWIIYKNLPYSDPEESLSSGNLQGIQEGAYPAVRSISFNLKATF
ncbi:MAG TPA: SusC/RagA family TonB-linked outer membrane protein [Mucilaginibacter sp.]|nr:SusC/RagA family TonB-linked outer membrane protein [Mucilaginibacter sp.]